MKQSNEKQLPLSWVSPPLPDMDYVTVEVHRAAKKRDRGIRRAEDHANAEQGDWKTPAMLGLKHFLNARGAEPFLAEEFVEWSKVRCYAQPPDGRAWGAVFSTANRQGLIEQIGWKRAVTSNLSAKPLWRKK